METHMSLLKAELSLLKENVIRMKLAGNRYTDMQVLPPIARTASTFFDGARRQSA